MLLPSIDITKIILEVPKTDLIFLEKSSAFSLSDSKHIKASLCTGEIPDARGYCILIFGAESSNLNCSTYLSQLD